MNRSDTFTRMFAEKILQFHEGANRALLFLQKWPLIGSHIHDDIFEKKNTGLRNVLGGIAWIGTLLTGFVQKLVYMLMLIYLPYRIIAHFRPLIYVDQKMTIMYLFFWMTIVCGSIANNTILSIGDRDYMMIRVYQISPYLNFLGRFLYKVLTDLVYYALLLMLFGVGVRDSLLLSFVTACARPIGEMLEILCFAYMRPLYQSRSIVNGAVMAACTMIAYGGSLLAGRIASGWMFLVSPVFVVLMFAAGAGAMYFLWWYKYYRAIIREALVIKHA